MAPNKVFRERKLKTRKRERSSPSCNLISVRMFYRLWKRWFPTGRGRRVCIDLQKNSVSVSVKPPPFTFQSFLTLFFFYFFFLYFVFEYMAKVRTVVVVLLFPSNDEVLPRFRGDFSIFLCFYLRRNRCLKSYRYDNKIFSSILKVRANTSKFVSKY